MSEPVVALRYFTVPNDIEITPGIGLSKAGTTGFSTIFRVLILGRLAHAGNLDSEDFLVSVLMRAQPGQRIELPEAHWTALVAALPLHLSEQLPDLYAELLPFLRAVQRAPSVKPAGWDPPLDTTPLA